MVAMHMGEKYAIYDLVAQAGGLNPAVSWLPTINQHRDFAKAIQVGGMIPIRAWPAIADTKAL
jgi:hypothetical protein